MTAEQKIARIFALDDTTWLRHANPWSVILRFTLLPLFIIAFWSRLWFGWSALSLVILVILWTWINPRIFSSPQSFDRWRSKAVLGERVWLNRDIIPVPVYHRTIPNILSMVSGVGILFIIWGVFEYDLWPTLFGTMLVYLGKAWFLDRMVWLWQDMKDSSNEYRSWVNVKEDSIQEKNGISGS